MNNQTSEALKVKIVAIAKDEGAYLAEWISHHLFMGFDAIDIYVNRTTDNTVEVLKQINHHYPNVNYYSADWVDYCHFQVSKHLQYVIYGKAFEENRLAKEFDYLLFIDVDEFWCTQGFNKGIKEVIVEQSMPKAMVFQWINEKGQEPPFRLLEDTISGYLSNTVKSLLHYSAPLKRLMLHYPEFSDEFSGVFADGTKFKAVEGQKQLMETKISCLREAMIIHRSNRSEMEYISLLFRGRPSDNIPIKLNRSGYNVGGRLVSLTVDDKIYEDYIGYREAFYKQIDCDELLLSAQEFVLDRAFKCIDAIDNVAVEYPTETLKAFRNISDVRVLNCLSKIKKIDEKKILVTKKLDSVTKSVIVKPSFLKTLKALVTKDANYLRDTAIYYEKSSPRLALFFMKKAKLIRPNGPLIIKKVKSYEDAIYNSRK